MTEQEKRRGGGAKLARSETVTVRLDPKLRYLAELAALKHRRTLSSFIEWAVEESLKTMTIDEGDDEARVPSSTLAEHARYLWDVEDADRFAKLALRFPELLTHEEQKRWKLIRENGFLWRGDFKNSDNEWRWNVYESSLLYERLRKYWDTFCAVARGEQSADKLPTWVRTNPAPPGSDGPDPDIPF